MDFIERAVEAYQERLAHGQERRAERDEKDRERLAKAFKRLTGELPDKMEGTELVHKAPLLFRRVQWKNRYDPSATFAIWGECPECGEGVWSQNIFDLASLGAMIEEFDPEFNHVCEKEPEEKSVEPKPADYLYLAVRRIVAEYLEEG